MATIINFVDGYSLEIDATIKRNHSLKANLTKYPVESGAKPSDHRVKENRTFSLDGIIDGVAKDSSDEDSLKAFIVFERFEQAHENNEPLEIITPRKTYKNMFITGASFPDEASQGTSLFFSLEVEELIFVETKTKKVSDVPKSEIKKTNPKLTQDKKAKESKKLGKKVGAKGHKGPKGKKESFGNKILDKYGIGK
jgi:hypothetical protein